MLKCNILKESEAVDDYLDYLDRKDEERFERMSPEAYERYRKEQQRKSELIQKNGEKKLFLVFVKQVNRKVLTEVYSLKIYEH